MGVRDIHYTYPRGKSRARSSPKLNFSTDLVAIEPSALPLSCLSKALILIVKYN